MARRDTWARIGKREFRPVVRCVSGEEHDPPAWSENIRLHHASISGAQAADRARETFGEGQIVFVRSPRVPGPASVLRARGRR